MLIDFGSCTRMVVIVIVAVAINSWIMATVTDNLLNHHMDKLNRLLRHKAKVLQLALPILMLPM